MCLARKSVVVAWAPKRHAEVAVQCRPDYSAGVAEVGPRRGDVMRPKNMSLWAASAGGLALLALLALAPRAAHADVVNPEDEACEGKRQGDACEADGRRGRCEPGECCRNDYSQGTPPSTVCSPCQTCRQGPPGSNAGKEAPESSGCAASPGAPGVLGGLGLLAGLALVIGLHRTRRPR